MENQIKNNIQNRSDDSISDVKTFKEVEQNWYCIGKHFQSFLMDMSDETIAGTHKPCSDCKYAMSGLCNPNSWLERFNVLSTASGIDVKWVMAHRE